MKQVSSWMGWSVFALVLLGPAGLAIGQLDGVSQVALRDGGPYAGHQLVEVEVNTDADLDRLMEISPDLWTDYPGPGMVPARIPPDRLADLQASGLKYVVLDDDLGPETIRHFFRDPLRGTWDDYMNLSEMNAFLDSLVQARPDLCSRITIGGSLEDRPVWVLHITGPNAGPKPAVFYHSLIHAREWIGGPVVLYLADYLVSNYDTDPQVQHLVDTLDIYLAPCVNPDGYSYTWTNYRLWRKNRRNNGDGTYGVDLNRNFGYGWGGPGSSSYTGDETYRGPYAFSEPETQVIRDFITNDTNILAHMDYHSYSELILWPFGNPCSPPPDPDRATFEAVGYQMQADIYNVHGHTYTAGPICTTIYAASGGSIDWSYGDQGRLGFSIELRPTSSYPGFELPPSEILPTCEENLPAILTLTDWAASQMGMQIELPNGWPRAVLPGAPTDVDVQIVPQYDTLVAGSPTLHYRTGGGAFQAVPLTWVAGNDYIATLPAFGCGDAPEFYISAEGVSTGVSYEPAGAPADVYGLVVGEYTTFFADNFETNTGWTVTNGPGLSDGQWDRGIPVNCDRGDPPTDYDGSGQCYLTDNSSASSCNSDVDGGSTYLISPTLDLAGQDGAEVRYALWYSNNYGSSPNADVFDIYVSNDNGANWTSVETVGPQSPSGWNEHSFVVSEFVTPTSTVKVRFEASDLGSGSVVEAGIDMFSVETFSCGCEAVNGDGNADCVVNLLDYALFEACLTGPDQGPAPAGCTAFMFDGDDDVDLRDLGAFNLVFDGP